MGKKLDWYRKFSMPRKISVQYGSVMSKTMTPTVWLRLFRRERATRFGRYPSLLAAVSIFFLVVRGMYRARGALFKTMETVEDEKPLALATSRIPTMEDFTPSAPQSVLPKRMVVYRKLADQSSYNSPRTRGSLGGLG